MTDGTDFTPGTTLTHESTGHLIALSLRAAVQTVGVGLASETETALTSEPARVVSVLLAVEAESAQSAAPLQIGSTPVGQPSESSIALNITPVHGVALGLAEETGSALDVTFRREVFVSLAAEANSAQRITIAGQSTAAALARRNNAGGGGARYWRATYPNKLAVTFEGGALDDQTLGLVLPNADVIRAVIERCQE